VKPHTLILTAWSFFSGPDMQALKLLELVMEHHAGRLALIPGTSTAPLVLPEDALRQEGLSLTRRCCRTICATLTVTVCCRSISLFRRFRFFSLSGCVRAGAAL
jgi:hypothetical protein